MQQPAAAAALMHAACMRLQQRFVATTPSAAHLDEDYRQSQQLHVQYVHARLLGGL
jgi:hypothetical protein